MNTEPENPKVKCLRLLVETLTAFQEAKPEDRSSEARTFAVMITDLEKIFAYFTYYVPAPSETKKEIENP